MTNDQTMPKFPIHNVGAPEKPLWTRSRSLREAPYSSGALCYSTPRADRQTISKSADTQPPRNGCEPLTHTRRRQRPDFVPSTGTRFDLFVASYGVSAWAEIRKNPDGPSMF